MRLGKRLSSMTKPEIEEIREQLNLTDDEEEVFNELIKGRSHECISQKCRISLKTVNNRVHNISMKLERLKERW